jgi:hypothetical protein
MPPPFKDLLAEFVRHAPAGDDLAKRLFRDGDEAHLKRWAADGRGPEIYEAIRGGKGFTVKSAFAHIMTTLQHRRLAEDMDALNRTIGGLERRRKRLVGKERKRARKMLEKSEMSPAEFAALAEQIKEHEHPREFIGLDPLLSARSDRNGSRKRTLFCRALSDLLHHATGKWHDAEVAALCEIAFGCRDVKIDMVRSARRASTRKRRR